MIRIVLLAAALLIVALPLAPESAAFDCGNAVHKLQTNLPVTASSIRRGEDIVIVAIGSSSTAGAGASDPSHSYPAQLTRELQRRWPALAVTVLNKGIGGETAPQMVARFERDVLTHNPDLVIWQSGTNSLLKSESVDSYGNSLRAGIRQLKQAHADIILMDPQYAPRVLTSDAYQRVIETMRSAARESAVGLFPRFAVMQEWVTSGRASAAELVVPDGLHMNDASYACVARMLAIGIAHAVRSAPLPMAINTKSDASLR
jgi:acyl-CoA thioesterase I